SALGGVGPGGGGVLVSGPPPPAPRAPPPPGGGGGPPPPPPGLTETNGRSHFPTPTPPLKGRG
ncbi:hypothetical protein ABIB28_003405, partial [Sphingomonas sp. UYEF23]